MCLRDAINLVTMSNIPLNKVVGSLIYKTVDATAVIDFLPGSISHFLFGIIMAAFNED